jgi:hypothetical protein
MQSRITSLNTERKEWSPQELVDLWQHHLQEHDRSTGTVKKYTQAVVRFLAWYEQEEQAPLQLSTLTPITLIGYRNKLHLVIWVRLRRILRGHVRNQRQS